jgi:starch-binding outer membrane protein, SusD/RagB family
MIKCLYLIIGLILGVSSTSCDSKGIRWHDLVRKNKYVIVLKNKFINKDETTNQEYATFASRANSRSYLYPIPQSQIDITNGLYKQNPGY